MIKPRSSQLDPASHKRIKHISTQPINHPTSSNRPKSKKFQNKTKAHNSKHHVTQQPPSAMAPLIATHLSSSNPTIQHHMIHIYQKKKNITIHSSNPNHILKIKNKNKNPYPRWQAPDCDPATATHHSSQPSNHHPPLILT